jgi:hypothetical protein
MLVADINGFKKKKTLTAGWWMLPGRACQLVLDARVEPGATLVARSWPEFNSTQLLQQHYQHCARIAPEPCLTDLLVVYENVYSHAYIAFRTEGLVARFSCEYDGHIFKDEEGPSFRHLFFGA